MGSSQTTNPLAGKRLWTANQPVSHPERSEPWFEDGNIVIEAGFKQFKVYRGILAASSEVFRDMFLVPQPIEQGSVDGCPIVHLSDSPDDVRYILDALCNRRCQNLHLHCDLQSNLAPCCRNYFTDKKPQPFALLAAFVRLGRKYEIHQLRDEAINRLCRVYPIRLKKWLSMEDKFTHIIPEDTVHLDVIHLAQENDLPYLLPAAFLLCYDTFTHQQMLEGVHRNDGTLAVLSAEDQRMITLGWHALIAEQFKETYKWMDTAEDEGLFKKCTSPEECNAARRENYYCTFYPAPDLKALDDWDEDWADELCDSCAAVSIRQHKKGRTNIWNELPSFFGLPPWAEMLKE
jgi:hypothetical protein